MWLIWVEVKGSCCPWGSQWGGVWRRVWLRGLPVGFVIPLNFVKSSLQFEELNFPLKRRRIKDVKMVFKLKSHYGLVDSDFQIILLNTFQCLREMMKIILENCFYYLFLLPSVPSRLFFRQTNGGTKKKKFRNDEEQVNEFSND
jgi:hypothetical protein